MGRLPGLALPAKERRSEDSEHDSHDDPDGTQTDQDGDEVVLMESEWISMHLLPRMQAVINRFVFRPTGNDIVELLTPKIRMLGGGILMDCLWEQDWRFPVAGAKEAVPDLRHLLGLCYGELGRLDLLFAKDEKGVATVPVVVPPTKVCWLIGMRSPTLIVAFWLSSADRWGLEMTRVLP